jgi:Leucine-rich repeat (LRR) protein
LRSAMPVSLKDLYKRIKKDLTPDHLKRITVDIIESYKNRDFAHLKKYISVLGLDAGTQSAKLFSLLVMRFHPDRLTFIQKQADELFEKSDLDGLAGLHDGYFFDIASARPVPDLHVDVDEKYAFDEDDFAYHEEEVADNEEPAETDLDFGEEKHGFMEAVHRLFAGGLEVIITAADLLNLEGALDLSDYDIEDLDGAEHCLYINELNLSNNRIEKIGHLAPLVDLFYLFLSNNLIESIAPLEELVHLKELDLSFNNISDISVLEKLGELEYVNLLGNPVRDYSVVERLMKKGIIVIFDGKMLK